MLGYSYRVWRPQRMAGLPGVRGRAKLSGIAIDLVGHGVDNGNWW